MSDVLAIIPARGGSKAVPRKNLALLGGRPLLAYTAAAALAARRIRHALLSTDDPEIAAVGRDLGLAVPWLRPAELSADDTPMLPVMTHALDWAIANGRAADIVLLLQPTSPFRSGDDIDAALDLMAASGADAVVSVVEVPHQYSPASVMTLGEAGLVPFMPGPPILRRQDKPRVFARNGPAILAVTVAQLRRGSFYGGRTEGYVMDVRRSLDIDTTDDLWLAEQMIRREKDHA